MNNIDERPRVYRKGDNGRYIPIGSMSDPFVWDSWQSEGFWYHHRDGYSQGAALIIKKENLKAPAIDYANACVLTPQIEEILRKNIGLQDQALEIVKLIAEQR